MCNSYIYIYIYIYNTHNNNNTSNSYTYNHNNSSCGEDPAALSFGAADRVEPSICILFFVCFVRR